MSRIGKKPILIPENVEVKIEDQKITVKGPRGELSKEIQPEIRIEVKKGKVFVLPKIETQKTKALWGLTRTLIANMIQGVREGYEKKLEIEGLGFRAELSDKDLLLYIGFSHPVKIKARPEIQFLVEKNIITVSGFDKELVGQIAAEIRRVKPPEPYKGKGIKYLGEVIRRKAGKKVVTVK